MNEVSIRINTTRFIASMKGRPSKIRWKRDYQRYHIEFSPFYGINSISNGQSLADDEQPNQ